MLMRLPAYIAAFFLALAVANAIPHVIVWYRERYKASLNQTARELNRFFFDVKPAKIILGSVAVAAVIGLLTQSWVLAVFLCLAGVFAPRVVLSMWKQMRAAKVDAQLMDALVLLGNAVKSGLDMAAGMELISTNMKPPISEEFGLVVNSYRLGTPLEVALIDLTNRVPSRTLETTIYAINLQRETGGNIVKTFDQLVTTIREENKLQKKVKAMTSQGRTQIYFLAGFPWVLALIFYLASPDMMRPAIENPWGQVVVLGLLVWEAIGILVTKKIVTVDI